MLKLWKEIEILNDDAFKKIEANLDGIEAPSDTGKLPTKLVNAFGFFTADELKNWTVLFSIYALKDVMPEEHLEYWRSFVLASRILCSKVLTDTSVRLADQLILKFCKQFEEIFGQEYVTPNMHLHGHLIECLFDYGPIYSFWLFSFERFYGLLGGLPTNKRLIEVQIFRRFLRDSICYEITLPEELNESLGTIMEGLLETGDRGTLKEISTKSLYPIHRLARRCLHVADQNWSDLSSITYKCLSKPFSLTELQLRHLKNMYKVLYPDAEVIIPCVSFRKSRHVYLGTDIYWSVRSRTRRSAAVLAFWHHSDGAICSFNDTYLKLKPGLVEFYLLHNVLVDREYKEHLPAKVQWMKATNSINYFGNPIEVWYAELFELDGPASFIPVQRLKCKFVKIEKELWHKKVAIVCPRDRAVNLLSLNNSAVTCSLKLSTPFLRIAGCSGGAGQPSTPNVRRKRLTSTNGHDKC